MARDISIGRLERSVRTLAKQLEKKGYTTEVSVHRSGHGYSDSGFDHTSNVELEVTKPRPDDTDRTVYVVFIANGYCGTGRREIGNDSGWKPMKEEALRRIQKALEPEEKST